MMEETTMLNVYFYLLTMLSLVGLVVISAMTMPLAQALFIGVLGGLVGLGTTHLLITSKDDSEDDEKQTTDEE